MNRPRFLLALDQGTSSSRSIVFDTQGRIASVAQREFRRIFPQPGWVEHDPQEIRTSHLFGHTQVDLFGQTCFGGGLAKNTYGTGCFMLMHTGEHCLSSSNGLIATRAAQAAAAPSSPSKAACSSEVRWCNGCVTFSRRSAAALRASGRKRAGQRWRDGTARRV